MAPELLEDNVFTEKGDVYSFAIVLWEIWDGGIPWAGLKPPQIIRKVIDKRERPAVPEGMPDDLREVMCRSWAHEPAARPTFHDLSAQLRASSRGVWAQIAAKQLNIYVVKICAKHWEN